MITIDDNSFIDFSNMGLFVGGKGWIHPETSVPTHELVFVVKGKVFIEESGSKYALTAGDALVLEPHKIHGGYEKSDDASFFWLHFYANNYERFTAKRSHLTDVYNCVSFFSKLNHFAKNCTDKALTEIMLVSFLLENKNRSAEKNKLFHDACEYVRVNVADAPKVKDVADKFGYNADYLSRLFVSNCGLPLKKFIDRERMHFIGGLLQTTTLTLKEIAQAASFDDDNALIKFFVNREGCTPTQYRNRYFESHLNKK